MGAYRACSFGIRRDKYESRLLPLSSRIEGAVRLLWLNGAGIIYWQNLRSAAPQTCQDPFFSPHFTILRPEFGGWRLDGRACLVMRAHSLAAGVGPRGARRTSQLQASAVSTYVSSNTSCLKSFSSFGRSRKGGTIVCGYSRTGHAIKLSSRYGVAPHVPQRHVRQSTRNHRHRAR
jgi:hypothetical protein